MTYRQLLQKLSELTEEQLDSDVTILSPDNGEIYGNMTLDFAPEQ